MEVITVIHKYPRKATEASVWVVEGAGEMASFDAIPMMTSDSLKRLFCAHPATEVDRAENIAAAWRMVIATEEGRALVVKAHQDGF